MIRVASGVFVVTLILYVATLAPSVVTLFDDSLEFQLVTYQLGIAHPTGYPLYTLLGYLFTLIPVGNVAYRVNLMSAVFGAATVTLVYILTHRIALTFPEESSYRWRSRASYIAAAFVALHPIFWEQATIAEVYTLNSFFVALILLLAYNLSRNYSVAGLVGLAFVVGLALTHHRTIVLLFPALVLHLFIVSGLKWLKPRTFGLATLSFLLPLLLYAYLPLRGHIGSLDGTYQNTLMGFWQQVTASGYNTFLFDNPFNLDRDVSFYANLLAPDRPVGIVIIILLILALSALAFAAWSKRFPLLSLTAFLAYLGFNLFYTVSDIAVFFIPNLLILAIWMSIGTTMFLIVLEASINGFIDGFLEVSGFQMQRKYSQVLLLGGVTIVLTLLYAPVALPQIWERNTWDVHDYGLDILQQPLEENAVIVGIVGEMTLIRYFQQTEGLRPDVETIAADLESERRAVVADLINREKAVYLTRELPGIGAEWPLDAVGPLIRVDGGQALPTGITRTNQAVLPGLELVAYEISYAPRTGTGPLPVRITAYWHLTQTLTADLKVSARLLATNEEVIVADDVVPVHFTYPTRLWREGEIVSDVYTLHLPVDAPAGDYTPVLIWYDPAQNNAEVGRVSLMPIAIDN